MKKRSCSLDYPLLLSVLLFTLFSSCSDDGPTPVVYPLGSFPDTVINMTNLNSQYDDYNMALPILSGDGPVIFSSNRKSQGGQFDLVQGGVRFQFNQTDGRFEISSEMTSNEFLTALLNKAVTSENDFGPNRFFSSEDGFEYTVVSSVNNQGNLDMYYLKNRPQFDIKVIPSIEGPFPLSLINTISDDGYFCFDLDQDSAYFTSNRNGNFDIFLQVRPAKMAPSDWFNQGYSTATRVDSINSSADDKCPQILQNIMVFTSNRLGGMGGYDLYYSVLRKGKWSTPVNLGPEVNTPYDEYRPQLGYHPQFSNYFLLFSSNRPEGKGGFDLYFTGIDIKK